MRAALRTTAVTVTTLVALGTVGPVPGAAATGPDPSHSVGAPQGWWCRLTHLC